MAETQPSSWRERLLGVVRAHLEEGRDRADAVKGAFEVRGDLPDAEGAFELVAGAWLDQPEGWITVGLRGRFEDNCTLSGEITDGEGDQIVSHFAFGSDLKYQTSPSQYHYALVVDFQEQDEYLSYRANKQHHLFSRTILEPIVEARASLAELPPCVRELRALGFTSAAVIGEVTEVLTPEEACPASLIDVAVD